MKNATQIIDEFYEAARKHAIDLTYELPHVPTDKCECGSTDFQIVELAYERTTRLEVKDGELFAYPDGFDDYSDQMVVPFAICPECDKAYNISQQLIEINYI